MVRAHSGSLSPQRSRSCVHTAASVESPLAQESIAQRAGLGPRGVAARVDLTPPRDLSSRQQRAPLATDRDVRQSHDGQVALAPASGRSRGRACSDVLTRVLSPPSSPSARARASSSLHIAGATSPAPESAGLHEHRAQPGPSEEPGGPCSGAQPVVVDWGQRLQKLGESLERRLAAATEGLRREIAASENRSAQGITTEREEREGAIEALRVEMREHRGAHVRDHMAEAEEKSQVELQSQQLSAEIQRVEQAFYLSMRHAVGRFEGVFEEEADQSRSLWLQEHEARTGLMQLECHHQQIDEQFPLGADCIRVQNSIAEMIAQSKAAHLEWRDMANDAASEAVSVYVRAEDLAQSLMVAEEKARGDEEISYQTMRTESCRVATMETLVSAMETVRAETHRLAEEIASERALRLEAACGVERSLGEVSEQLRAHLHSIWLGEKSDVASALRATERRLEETSSDLQAQMQKLWVHGDEVVDRVSVLVRHMSDGADGKLRLGASEPV